MNDRQQEDAIMKFIDLEGEVFIRIWREWLQAMETPPEKRGRQKWDLVSKSKLNRVWKSFAKYGSVRNEDDLEDIVSDVTTNVAKIVVNTILLEHEQMSPAAYVREMLERDGSEDIPDTAEVERILEDFGDFAVDEKGMWRLSDYGVDKMRNYSIEALGAETPEEKIVAIDKVLNVVHQRSDLASWFVEGGSNSLSELFNVFDLNKLGARTGGQEDSDFGMWGMGFYFTPTKKHAYGNKSIAAYLSIQNPLIMVSDDEWPEDLRPVRGRLASEKRRSYLLDLGYDGVIHYDHHPDRPHPRHPSERVKKRATQIAAFFPEQIKSVDNDGTWNANDPDIRSNPPFNTDKVAIEYEAADKDDYRHFPRRIDRAVVIKSLYVPPKFRGAGAARHALKQFVARMAKEKTSILLDPFPFEMDRMPSDAERDLATKKLISLYESVGFKTGNVGLMHFIPEGV